MKHRTHMRALLHAVIAIAYILLVALFMSNAENFFNEVLGPVFIITTMLLLLVVSVAVMGITIFGLPLMWYLDGKKKDAVHLALWTVGFLILFAIDIIVTLALAA